MKNEKVLRSKLFVISLVASIFIFGNIRSFAYEWSKTFGGSNGDYGKSVQQTADGGFIIVGYTSSSGPEWSEVYLIKTDGSGSKQWSETFEVSGQEWGESVQQTADGGFIIVGYTSSSGPALYDVYLIKTDSSGKEQWSSTFGGSGEDRGNSVQQTADGGFIITGYTSSFSAALYDVYLIKTDGSGKEQWSKTFGGSSENLGYAVKQTADGGFIIAGHTRSYGAEDHDVYLIKTDVRGNEQWSKTFGGSGWDWGFSVQQTTDGGFIVAGGTHSFGVGKSDVYLIKTDDRGGEQWSKTFGGSNYDRGYSVQQTADGGFIIAGYTSSFGAGSYDVYLIKTDDRGSEQWSKTFGGSGHERGESVQQTVDGGFIIAGHTNSFGAGEGDVYLIYYLPDEKNLFYTPVTPCRIVDTRKVGGIIDAFRGRAFHVYGSAAQISAQGGNTAGCSSPSGEPSAVHVNMVAVDPTGKGNLQAYPVGVGPGAGLSVNYNTIDTNLANAGTIMTKQSTGADIWVTSRYSSAHTAIDVLGYYYPDGDLLYTPVKPCRIVDTRKTSDGIIGSFEQRNFRVYGSGGIISAQGGNTAGCPSPQGDPLAAHINMVAVNPTGKGNLQAFPLGAGPGAGLSVNYNTIDTNLANAGTVQVVIGSGADFTVTSRFSSAHTAVDVLGYYYPAGDLLYTPVKPCRIVDTRKTSDGIIGSFEQRNFRVYGSGGIISAQGGNTAGCPSPQGDPLAAHINMVAVNPTGKGNLQAFPLGAGPGAGLSVNYNTIDTNLANAGTVQTVTGLGADLTVTSRFSSAHTAIDVLGYYYSVP